MQTHVWKKKLNSLPNSMFESGKEWEVEDCSMERSDMQSKIGNLPMKLGFVVKTQNDLARNSPFFRVIKN